ncbi:hypothetical protein C7379_11477 [Hallella colorans]|uniref:Uncharacterized protein n=1 Tax=Hallella colorans TaxID=1703337 RepID=A0A2U0U530_9BACT|nr:hypothetical protein C7379_11477 [Hallella colorans]
MRLMLKRKAIKYRSRHEGITNLLSRHANVPINKENTAKKQISHIHFFMIIF